MLPEQLDCPDVAENCRLGITQITLHNAEVHQDGCDSRLVSVTIVGRQNFADLQ